MIDENSNSFLLKKKIGIAMNCDFSGNRASQLMSIKMRYI